MRTCPKCNAINNDSVRFCGKCGESLEQTSQAGSNVCPKCQTPNNATAKFCLKCGNPLNGGTTHNHDVKITLSTPASNQKIETDIICPFCQSPVKDLRNDLVICNKCGTPHHKDCWNENGKCTVYGCESTECRGMFDTFDNNSSNQSQMQSYEPTYQSNQTFGGQTYNTQGMAYPQPSNNNNITGIIIACVGAFLLIGSIVWASVAGIRERNEASEAASYTPPSSSYDYGSQTGTVQDATSMEHYRITVDPNRTIQFISLTEDPVIFKWGVMKPKSENYTRYYGDYSFSVTNNKSYIMGVEKTGSSTDLKLVPVSEGKGQFTIRITDISDSIYLENNPRTLNFVVIDPDNFRIDTSSVSSLSVGQSKSLRFGWAEKYDAKTRSASSDSGCVSLSENQYEDWTITANYPGTARVTCEATAKTLNYTYTSRASFTVNVY